MLEATSNLRKFVALRTSHTWLSTLQYLGILHDKFAYTSGTLQKATNADNEGMLDAYCPKLVLGGFLEAAVRGNMRISWKQNRKLSSCIFTNQELQTVLWKHARR